jgi:hypothetical protein
MATYLITAARRLTGYAPNKALGTAQLMDLEDWRQHRLPAGLEVPYRRGCCLMCGALRAERGGDSPVLMMYRDCYDLWVQTDTSGRIPLSMYRDEDE